MIGERLEETIVAIHREGIDTLITQGQPLGGVINVSLPFWEQRSKAARHDAYLFLNSRGARLTETTFRKRLRYVSKSLLIKPYLTPHKFRHSAAMLLIEEGVDIRLVQRLHGHASIATTEIYTKVSDNSLVTAIERAETLAQVDA